MDHENSLQDVLRCHLCDALVPPLHCDICRIHLCKACVGEHVSDSSKEHKVVPFEMRGSTVIYPKCSNHLSKECELLCEKCVIPICVHCIVSDKHLGHKTKSILESFEAIKEVMKRDLTYLEDLSAYLRKILNSNEIDPSVFTYISGNAEFRRFPPKLTDHLPEFNPQKIYREQLYQQSDSLSAFSITTKKNGYTVDAPNVVSSSDLSIPTVETNSSSTLSSLVFKTVLNVFLLLFLPLKMVYNFQWRRYYNSLIRNLYDMCLIVRGELGYTIDSLSLEFSPLDRPLSDVPRIITEMSINERIHSMACLNDDAFIIGGDNKVMKLYNNQGKQVGSIKTKSGNKPGDIAVTRSGVIVYTDYDDRTVNIVEEENIKTLIKLQGWRPDCVCSTSSGDLLIVLDSDDKIQSKVVRYFGSSEKQSIQYNDKGQPLFSAVNNSKYINENSNLDICVSDYGANAVVVVDQAGNFRFTYTGHPSTSKGSFTPRCITTDSQGWILIADWFNHRIHVLDQDGQFLRYVDQCDLFSPWGLCVDIRDNLFVAEWLRSKVKKIQYYTPTL